MRFPPFALISCLAWALTSCVTPQSPAPVKSLVWQGQTFFLVGDRSAGGVSRLDYRSLGQTRDNWQNGITVELSREDPAAAMAAFLETTTKLRGEDAHVFKDEPSGDVIVDTILYDTAGDFLEHNLVKYSLLSKGILVKVFFRTRVKISDAKADPLLVRQKIGLPLDDRMAFLKTFRYFPDWTWL